MVVGGGFGGVKAALELMDDDRFDVTLLSENTDFRYYPTLFHAATGGKRAGSSIPLRSFFSNHRVAIEQGRAVTLDRKAKTVMTSTKKTYSYDVLILALGVVTNYFGIPGLKEFSYGIKSIEEAERLKDHLHRQLTDERKPDLNYCIVGAGPTGIELAGALPSYLRQLMKTHGIHHRAVHIDLIEAAPHLLPRSPRDASRMIQRRLRKLGIHLYLGKAVQGETANELMVNGKPIQSHTVIWTAGVTNNPFFKDNDFVLTKRGKVATDIYLQADDDIYVLGDNANTPYSGMAQTALYDGKFVATNLRRKASGWKLRSYRAKEPISVIPAGPHWAAVTRGNLRLYGRLGWALRSLADLIAFHDYEPWKQAGHQWLTEFGHEETCPTCTAALAE